MSALSSTSQRYEDLKAQIEQKSFTKESMTKFIQQLPKIELHAHLNGCIRESTLASLASERNVKLSSLLHDLQQETHFTEEEKMNGNPQEKVNKKRRSLLECFEIFTEIGLCVTDLVALKQICIEALEDFAKQGVVYLELRSTPKVLLDTMYGTKATKKDYIDTILKCMTDFEEQDQERYNKEMEDMKHNANASSQSLPRLPMTCRYIVSINRAESIEVAQEHTQLAMEYAKKSKYVVGLDLSGSPLKNSFTDLEPCFRMAKDAGLKTSIHCGEIPCEKGVDNETDDALIEFSYRDTKKILDFEPDRLGHALLFTDEMYEALERGKKIPIECCPTSNVMTLELATHYEGDLVHGLRRHPRLSKWLENDYPCSINTDDPGIFNTDSSLEFLLLVDAFGFQNPARIVSIVMDSIDHAFESDDFKAKMTGLVTSKINGILY